MSALPLSTGEGKGEGMHLQLASNISKTMENSALDANFGPKPAA